MSLTLFILPQLLVRFVVGYPVWDKKIRLLFYAAILPMIWHLTIPKELNDIRYVNFLQHALGGVSVGLVSIYFIKNFTIKSLLWSNIFLQLIFVYICVSAFGVANELLEFLLDWSGVGIFSADRYDVWFDLFANTIGSFCVFGLYKILSFFK